jgi:hypothetical protein
MQIYRLSSKMKKLKQLKMCFQIKFESFYYYLFNINHIMFDAGYVFIFSLVLCK